MATKPTQSIEELLEEARIAITNALENEEIAAELAEVGYTPEVIQGGQALYNTAFQLFEEQKREYAEQYDTTDELDAAKEEANKVYKKYRKMAKVALKKAPAKMNKVDILERVKTTFPEWLGQVKRFYENALSDEEIQTQLARFAITVEKLQAGKALIDNVEQLKAQQERDKSQAQDATHQRDQAIEEMEDWKADFFTIARIALEDKPQLLEMLGIRVR